MVTFYEAFETGAAIIVLVAFLMALTPNPMD